MNDGVLWALKVLDFPVNLDALTCHRFLYYWAALGAQVIWGWGLGPNWSLAAGGLALVLVSLRPHSFVQQQWLASSPLEAALLGLVGGVAIAWPGFCVVASIREVRTRLGMDSEAGRVTVRTLALVVLCLALQRGYLAYALDSFISWMEVFLYILSILFIQIPECGPSTSLQNSAEVLAVLSHRWTISAVIMVAPLMFLGLALEGLVALLAGATQSAAAQSLRAIVPKTAMVLGIWIIFQCWPEGLKNLLWSQSEGVTVLKALGCPSLPTI